MYWYQDNSTFPYWRHGKQTSIPTYQYISLAPKGGKKFSNSAIPWTKMTCQLLSYVQMNNEKSCILKMDKHSRKQNLKPRRVARTPRTVYVSICISHSFFSDKKVIFSVIIATTKSFFKTLKTGCVLSKQTENNWSLNKTQLKTKWKSVEIRHLLCTHNLFSNQVELIEEIRYSCKVFNTFLSPIITSLMIAANSITFILFGVQ